MTDSNTTHIDFATPAPEPPKESSAVIVEMTSVETKRLEWIWCGRIPLGKLTVIDGDPGLGKSLVTIDIAARVTANAPMPDGTTGHLVGPRGVVLLSAEDDPADTLKPRLQAAGADLSRVVLLAGVKDATGERMPCLGDLNAIEAVVQKVDAALVVVDPFMAFLGSKDSHKDQDIRALLAPLAKLAARLLVAVVVVRHLNKNSREGNSLYRGGGTIGIVGAARSSLVVARDPEDTPPARRRIVAINKNNLAPDDAPSLAYHIEVRPIPVAGDVPYVVWEGPHHATASDLLSAGPADRAERSAPARERAEEFLREMLASGPKVCDDVRKRADLLHIKEKTLRLGRERLGIVCRTKGPPGKQTRTWGLPGDAFEPEDATVGSSSLPSADAHGRPHEVAPDGHVQRGTGKEDVSAEVAHVAHVDEGAGQLRINGRDEVAPLAGHTGRDGQLQAEGPKTSPAAEVAHEGQLRDGAPSNMDDRGRYRDLARAALAIHERRHASASAGCNDEVPF